MLIQADARQIPLRDACVQCVVTSPPYWGLRDYGLARWVGGDDDCDHQGIVMRTQPAGTDKQQSNAGSVAVRSGDCACGAHRLDPQIGLEPTPETYVAELVAVFREIHRVLKADGTVWLNLGDSYSSGSSGMNGTGSSTLQSSTSRCNPTWIQGQRARRPADMKPKDLVGIPWRVAFALQSDGWYLRSDIIWHKPNPMPESVTDRPTKSHEYLFLLTKSERYFYNAAAIAEPADLASQRGTNAPFARDVPDGIGMKYSDYEKSRHKVETRNKRSVWTIPTEPYSGAHFATFPEALVEPCVLAGSRFGDLVYDPFSGSGTVLAVAERLGRRAVGTDLNTAYHELAKERTAQRGLRW